MSLLDARNVSVRLGDRPILHGVNLDVEAGVLVGLIGPNGAGKTTLLRAMAGLLPLETGSLSLLGAPLHTTAAADRARYIAYLPQGGQSHWDVTVDVLVSMGRLPHRGRWGGLTDTDRSAVTRALDACDVGHLRDRPVSDVSGGERARVMLARALAVEPVVLLADEPVASLDPSHQLDVLTRLRERAAAGAGVVVVLHDLSLATRYCHHLVLLNQGRVMASGAPETVLTPERLATSYGIRVHQGEAEGIPYVVPLARIEPGVHHAP